MIVEDNDELRNYLSQTLSEEYVVQVCSNGKEALTIIPEYKPELVISDIMMPEMRGDELCQAIKNNIETSHIPVILLTALNNEKDILSGLQIGADEYVVKPFNIGILKANVAQICWPIVHSCAVNTPIWIWMMKSMMKTASTVHRILTGNSLQQTSKRTWKITLTILLSR